MDKATTEWLVSSDERPTGGPEMGFDWYGEILAERSFKPDMPDTDLFDLCLYLRNMIYEDGRYERLARLTETLLLDRMSGRKLTDHENRWQPTFEPEEFRKALEAICAGSLSHMRLIDAAEIAHSHRLANGKAGERWAAVYDLARIQILRRISRAKPHASNSTPTSAATGAVTPDYRWLDGHYPDELLGDHEFGFARLELRLSEETLTPAIPDDVLLKLYVFLSGRSIDIEVWEVVEKGATDLLFSRMSGGPETPADTSGLGFDPEEYREAEKALTSGILPDYYLVSLHSYAHENSRGSDAQAKAWQRILTQSKAQVLDRMKTGAKS